MPTTMQLVTQLKRSDDTILNYEICNNNQLNKVDNYIK